MAHQHGFTGDGGRARHGVHGGPARVLRRYCDEVVTFFDADAAGQKAAERAEELLEPTGGGRGVGGDPAGAFRRGRLPA